MNVIQALAEELGWRSLERGQRSNATGGADVTVILAPQWSPRDIEILKRVAERVPLGVSVEVTDIDFLVEHANYGKVVPEAPIVTQTPVVAHYVAGHLTRLWQGPNEVEDYPG